MIYGKFNLCVQLSAGWRRFPRLPGVFSRFPRFSGIPRFPGLSGLSRFSHALPAFQASELLLLQLPRFSGFPRLPRIPRLSRFPVLPQPRLRALRLQLHGQ